MKKEFKVKKVKKQRGKKFYRELFELLAETAVFVFFVMTFVFQAFQIPTGSMEPTLLVGDFLLVNKMVYYDPVIPVEDVIIPRREIKRHDIVVFKFPDDLRKDFVKRVIALENEKVEIKDKQVYVDDMPLTENYKVHIDSQNSSGDDYYNYQNSIRGNFGPIYVPAGYCFVMGDNRDNSQDSRTWGFLDRKLIKGKPWVVYFSYDAETDAWKKTGLKERLKKFANFIINR